jgi:hypothetical protein
MIVGVHASRFFVIIFFRKELAIHLDCLDCGVSFTDSMYFILGAAATGAHIHAGSNHVRPETSQKSVRQRSVLEISPRFCVSCTLP